MLDVSKSAAYPTWSPSGRKNAFRYGNGIGVISATGAGLRDLSDDDGCCPDWSPGGRKLAYSVGTDSGSGPIKVMNPDGTRQQVVARTQNGQLSLVTPGWSPDGQQLAFCLCAGPDSANPETSLGIISSYGGRIRRLLAPLTPIEPDWSPEGARIVFSEGYDEIMVVNFRTNRIHDLHSGQHPRWSPNGRRIVYADLGRICVMNANGRRAHILVGAPATRLSRPCVR